MAKQNQKMETPPPSQTAVIIPINARIEHATAEYVAAAKASERASREAETARLACDDASDRYRKLAAVMEELRKKLVAVIHESHEIKI